MCDGETKSLLLYMQEAMLRRRAIAHNCRVEKIYAAPTPDFFPSGALINVGPFYIEKSVHLTPNIIISLLVNFKTTLFPSQDPKRLNNIDFIGW